MKRHLLSLMGILLTFLNCAYYNTFYNAQKYHSEGYEQLERGGSGAQSFKKSIEKCKKILEMYRGSKWVDDAIFLMGKNFYYIKQYEKARINFEKIIEHFPESPFIPETHLFLGKISLESGELYEAQVHLRKASEAENKEITMEAFKTKLKIFLSEDKPEQAIEAGQEFIEQYKLHTTEVYYIMGNAYKETGNFKEAIKMFKRAKKEAENNIPGDLKYSMAETYLQMDSLESALKIMGDDLDDDTLKILKGKILQKMGEFEKAEETFSFAENWRNKIGATVNYHLGMIREEQNDYKKAREYMEKASSFGDFGEITIKSRAREEIFKNKLLLETDTLIDDSIETNDSLKENSEPDFLTFRTGEIYYMELSKPYKGIEWYRKVYDEFPESKYAPKALYAIIHIYLNDLKDREKAKFYLKKLKNDYGETEYLKTAGDNFETITEDSAGTGKE